MTGTYDDEVTRRLVSIAASLFRTLGIDAFGKHMALVGGMVPTLLCGAPPEGVRPHAGTGDIDIHLSLHLLAGATDDYYESLIDTLSRFGLKSGDDAEPNRYRWRWRGRIGADIVTVDLLCPRRDEGKTTAPTAGTVAEENIGPAGEIRALGVKYGYLVPLDTELVDVRALLVGDDGIPRGEGAVTVPVCGVTAWLCLKSDALGRMKDKDSYDVVWLLEALGPEEVAERVAASRPLAEHREAVVEALEVLIEDFRSVDAVGPGSYSMFTTGLPDDPAARAKATSLFAAFTEGLKAKGVLVYP